MGIVLATVYLKDKKPLRLNNKAIQYSINSCPDFILHNENGPAIIYDNGTKYYFIDGKKHRINGPAVIFNNDNNGSWFYNNKYVGTNLTQEEFDKHLKRIVFE